MKYSESYFLKYIDKKQSGCWEYTKGLTVAGYGRVSINKKRVYAHRHSFYFFNGFISEDYHVCHSCDNPKCVNPSHLWLGTDKDNATDMKNKGRSNNGWKTRTHCKNGHELVEANIYRRPNSIARNCIICRKNERRKRYVEKGL